MTVKVPTSRIERETWARGAVSHQKKLITEDTGEVKVPTLSRQRTARQGWGTQRRDMGCRHPRWSAEVLRFAQDDKGSSG